MKVNWSQYKKMGLGVGLSVCLLMGCSKENPVIPEFNLVYEYQKPEILLLVATEKNRYQKVYTEQIWEVEVDESGTTFETYLIEHVHEFLKEIKMTNLLAEQNSIVVSPEEKEQISALSDEFFSHLTDADLSYTGITRKDVVQIYESYFLANKTVLELTKDLDLEISDSEAKVITVQRIRLEDEGKAKEAYEKVLQEGSDFVRIAKEYSSDTKVEYEVGRGEEPGELEDVQFQLAEGEISDIVFYDNHYFIIKSINEYNKEETKERKKELYQQRKKEAFDSVYNQFKEEKGVEFRDEIWNQISFTNIENVTTADFFDLYKKYFPD